MIQIKYIMDMHLIPLSITTVKGNLRFFFLVSHAFISYSNENFKVIKKSGLQSYIVASLVLILHLINKLWVSDQFQLSLILF